jgi:hypothetical protein
MFSRSKIEDSKSTNDTARVMPQFGGSLTDDFRVVIYERNMFIRQATAMMRSPTLAASQ